MIRNLVIALIHLHRPQWNGEAATQDAVGPAQGDGPSSRSAVRSGLYATKAEDRPVESTEEIPVSSAARPAVLSEEWTEAENREAWGR